ncbi:DeoR family transcriptional regulator [Ligilactobacillus salitolerans]|uniref:Lactose phosphotransferase system repressor n=1 Tax=Ligilactobacillus salitolerans TaxID=1808352 RepID=A0A401IQH6_9LACO|nr:DeoR/GlpR family DNA-binding transcription regulator [Ligilactobacillus salitolerans]GBG93788.1 DeoR family transcriptional regulator [Ligilactobacillus salitolerans]
MTTKRIDQLLNIVNQKQKIAVKDLSEMLNVSKVTVRKDLSELEAKGLLVRKHGFAIINNPSKLNYRLAQNYEIKQKIALAASELINEQETIMVESGSTCALLVQELGKQGKHVTVITNSYFIADFVSEYSNIEVFVLGGKYQPESEVVVGPIAKDVLKNFQVGRLFIGMDGFDERNGFYGRDIMRADIVQAMAQNAQQLIILSDSTKFSQFSLVKLASFEETDQIITDQQIPDTVKKILEEQQIIVQEVD